MRAVGEREGCNKHRTGQNAAGQHAGPGEAPGTPVCIVCGVEVHQGTKVLSG